MLLETLEYLGIAFVCSVLLIIMSKIILQALIRRPADYYNARELREEELMLNAGGISITKEHETNPEGEIIEDKHLEAHLGDIEPAEPEEIMLEVPEAVAESIEVRQEEAEQPEEETAAEVAEETEETSEELAAEETNAAETEAEPADTEPIEETETSEEVSEEPEAETAEEQAEVTEEASEEPAVEPEKEPKTPEEQFGFSIKARTSRTRKPKKKEEEEAAEELEEAKAAMDEARARAEDAEPVSEWTESYAEIRDSLEKAFTERRRKPSMHMNKKELTEIAAAMGIELPYKATKREILDLINAKEDQAEE